MKPFDTIAQQQSALLGSIQGDDYSTAYDARSIAVYQRHSQNWDSTSFFSKRSIVDPKGSFA